MQQNTEPTAATATTQTPRAEHSANQPYKPLLRGWLHAGTTPLAIAAGVLLIVFAHGTASKLSAVVYLVSSVLLFGNSALYHRLNWSAKNKRILRRIDHANIYLLIAGTYTPIAVGTLPTDNARILLFAVWAAAVAGVAIRVFWLGAPRLLYVGLYIAMGWAAVFFLPKMFTANNATVILLIIGGLIYTAGAVFYAFKWPLRNNQFFGFHELFHACTVAAFFCHWVGALLALLNPLYLR
ncbi:hemolysin III family protein [Canibacter sp. lx-72]|uniref:PAQR family membrane homeostasis protein TrhA n=1 Tax=Canibacter zhuwentaonis TaxID=2837491 RepID=UPI001BDC3B26|nr:hemolysin III family protein [Canibacter zhuwentaonis]MBT1018203.1 hemolysin III family protein [Canibacter zhuwentaonis]MBT1035214.1 hemolysin III family protein [Canibacter zhuwentaonis]